MNIKKLWNKFELQDWWIYKDPLFKPFIDTYMHEKIDLKFKLFHKYLIGYDLISSIIKDHFRDFSHYYKNNIFIKDTDEINFKSKKVQEKMYDYWEIYIGICYCNKKYYHLFLHTNKWKNENNQQLTKRNINTKYYFNVNGFHIFGEDESYKKVKEYSKINNLEFYVEPTFDFGRIDKLQSLYENIKELSEQTKKQLNLKQ